MTEPFRLLEPLSICGLHLADPALTGHPNINKAFLPMANLIKTCST
jgi:hypothetical protein